jgi:UDP-glucose 4-epimerase
VEQKIKRVVILGHTGFVGSRLLAQLRRGRPDVEVVGRAPASLDLTDEAGARSLAEIIDGATAVIMCSAVKRQFGDTLEAYTKNVAMVTNLCRVLERQPAARILYFSSAAVYGEDVHNTEISEGSCVEPRSYYGAAKFASECLLRKHAEAASSTSLVCLRPPLIYGPGDEGETYGPSGFVRKAVRGEQVTLWGDGAELREFLFLDDIAELVSRLVFSDFSGVLNAASGKSYTFRHALDLTSAIAGRELLAGSRPRTKQSVDNAFRNQRLQSLFPDFTFVGLEEGIGRTYEAESRIPRAARLNER